MRCWHKMRPAAKDSRRVTCVGHTACTPDFATPLKPPAAARRAGFSLIEILVATSVLMVIVMIISMVFQQTSGAYQSGTQRIKAQTVLRSILGSIARDLTLAVDDFDYGDDKNNFGKESITFVALTGTPDSGTKQTPQLIEFTYSGGRVTRTRYNLKSVRHKDGTIEWTSDTASRQQSILNPNQVLRYLFFQYTYTPDNPDFPLRVDIEGAVESRGKATFISGASAGPDRIWGTKDDVIVGGR